MSAKCKVCDKTAYPMDPQINLDGSVFHKECAKCADCKCQITIANFSKVDNTQNPDQSSLLLLCKTHYFTRFKTSGGSYAGGDKFKSAGLGPRTSITGNRASISRVVASSSKCKICSLSVYPMDPQINLDGSLFHKACAKCADCKCQISIANFTKNESAEATLLLCKTHYFNRFQTQGSYVGGEKFANKNARDVNASALALVAADPLRHKEGGNEHVFNFKSSCNNSRRSSNASTLSHVSSPDASIIIGSRETAADLQSVPETVEA